MTIPEQYDERAARKVFVRNRQKLVFSIAVAVLTVAMVVALLVFYGVIGKQDRVEEAKPNFGVAAPCLPDGFDGKRIDPAQITIRTSNATKYNGLARAVQDELVNRGYTPQDKSVFDYYRLVNPQAEVKSENVIVLPRTTIYFGANAIPEAYTLGSLFTDATLQMDDRQDKLIDVVIGTSFYNLKNKSDASISDDAPLANITGCLTASSMQNLPKALGHTAV